jgi:hypothetical protein
MQGRPLTVANINRFIQHLHAAFEGLRAQVPMPDVEAMAVLVHSAMESPRRRYHCSQHALYMCEGMNPLQVLAAVFHDVVYYQLDDGFPTRLKHLLTPLVSKQGDDLVLLAVSEQDRAMQLCLQLFGFRAGQALPLFRGMNEFLSAAVAVRLLEPYLAQTDLIAVLACIEATVPFRAPQADGLECCALLAQRVREQACLRLSLSEGAEIDTYVDTIMRNAIAMANRDVSGFAEPSPAKFVSATWLLIEESNAPLAAVGVYTLRDYREALTRMQGFLQGLQAPRVFHHYAGYPAPQEFQRLSATAAANIAFAVSFLQLKMTSIAIIEALALQTGGNCPVSMFLGDIRSAFGTPERVEDYLPRGPDTPGLNAQLLQVLEKGRPEDSRNDLTISPVTAYMYRCMGVDGSAAALALAHQMVNGDLSPAQFLATLPPDMLGSMIDACARIAPSRRDNLVALKASLPKQSPQGSTQGHAH